MPEKIRAAVTSKEITPEEHSMQKGNDRKISKLSSENLHNMPGHPCESDTSSASAVEHLDEEALKGIASESDFKLFKEAWKRSIDANEEVEKIMSEISLKKCGKEQEEIISKCESCVDCFCWQHLTMIQTHCVNL